MQYEITLPGPLLTVAGELAQRGYAKRPLLTYEPSRIAPTRFAPFNRWRLKEWDYYAVTARDWFFSATVADVGYLGMAFIYTIDFASATMREATAIVPLGVGVRLPASSRAGDIVFDRRGVRLRFERRPDVRRLFVDWPRFHAGRPLHAELTARQPERIESIVMATPMGPKRFYYNEKINCLPTEGFVDMGDVRLEALPAAALASLDWGRGVWPYQTFWNWASASGFLPDGRTIGLNLGKGFGDLTAATENCFFIDGRMEKLGWVDFEYDPGNLHRPWHFIDDAGRLELTFTPFFERPSIVNLGALKTEAHQMFGHYDGFVAPAKGRKIKIDRLIGWAEEHHARW